MLGEQDIIVMCHEAIDTLNVLFNITPFLQSLNVSQWLANILSLSLSLSLSVHVGLEYELHG